MAVSTRRCIALIAKMPEVAIASPVVEVEAKIAGRDEPLQDPRHRHLPCGVHPAGVRRDRQPTGSTRSAPMPCSRVLPQARALGIKVGEHIDVQVALASVPLRVAGELVRDDEPAIRGDGHCGRAGRVRSHRPPQPARPAAAPGHRWRRVRCPIARCPAAGCPRSDPATSIAAGGSLSRVVSRESRGARARCALHGRPAGVLDAGARSGAPALAVRVATRARVNAAPAHGADRRRRRAPRRGREPGRTRARVRAGAACGALGRRGSRFGILPWRCACARRGALDAGRILRAGCGCCGPRESRSRAGSRTQPAGARAQGG